MIFEQTIAELTVRLACENPTWDYEKLQGALANLGYDLCPNTVKNILNAHGIEPAPEQTRLPSWSEFLKSHWESLAATDFFTTEVWTKNGLVAC
ncbi:MAG: helix-turn-helix domain-containing protein [Planctomycetales bacterium]|nr:helix-turn-helix domain-containing protein [Planctomycetales bacterium]